METLVQTINWFNNHRIALGILKDLQIKEVGREISLWAPGATRWNSMYDSAKSVMQSESQIRDAVTKHRVQLLRGMSSEKRAVACHILLE